MPVVMQFLAQILQGAAVSPRRGRETLARLLLRFVARRCYLPPILSSTGHRLPGRACACAVSRSAPYGLIRICPP